MKKKKNINKPSNEELDKIIDEVIEETRAIINDGDILIEEEVKEEVQAEEIPTEVEEEERVIEEEDNNIPMEDENVVNEEEHIVEGYAIVFNSLSEDLGGFRELILPTAINEETINNSDIFYLFNHNNNSIPLARSKNGEGSLKLTIDEKGLKYSFNCLNSEFYEIVKRGDLDKSSFAFSLPNDGSGEEWIKSNEYNYIRRITKIDKLYDCSAVLSPAYSSTELYARNNTIKKEVNDDYFIQYDEIINSLIQ